MPGGGGITVPGGAGGGGELMGGGEKGGGVWEGLSMIATEHYWRKSLETEQRVSYREYDTISRP